MLNGYIIEKRIGSGSYGSVYLVRNKQSNEVYAMKKICVSNIKTKEREYLISEILIQKANKCEYIIKLIDVFFENNNIYIVSEYAENGDLDKFIINFKKKRKNINNRTIAKLTLQLASALKYLHRNNIIHRDIKTSNVFLDKNYNIKLGDLGIAKIMGNRHLANTYIGTPYYMAPELYKGEQYDTKCDIWSLGCILYELITLNKPFEGRNIMDLANKIKYNNIDYRYIYKHKSEYSNMLNQMLQKNPNKRCDISFVYDNKFLGTLTGDNDYLIENCLVKTNKNFGILPKINMFSNWKYVIKEINERVADTIKLLSPRNKNLEFDSIPDTQIRSQSSPVYSDNRKKLAPINRLSNINENAKVNNENPLQSEYNYKKYQNLIDKVDIKLNKKKYSNNPYARNYLPKIQSEDNLVKFNRNKDYKHNDRYKEYLNKIKSEENLAVKPRINSDVNLPKIVRHSNVNNRAYNRYKANNTPQQLPKLERVPSRNIRGRNEYYKKIEVFKENYVSPYRYNRNRNNNYIYNSDAIKAVFNYGY